ncbi:MAG: succinate-semialdehyde dehydrogenase [Thermodesulfovibrio sp.]|nr:succinate-semialdehyde dehydrogenase [Thermodesulfovibrio sp.]
MKIQSINPYTEEVLEEFELMPPASVDRDIGSLRQAFPLWRDLAVSARTEYIRKLGAHLRAAKQLYARTITLEMGKPIREAAAEIEKCALLCDYYAAHGEKMLEPEEIRTEAKKSYVLFQPLGIVLAIMPWNFPFWQAFRFAVPAIMAGNVVALKHASSVPMSALAIEEAFRISGFPEYVMKTFLISAHEALRLIDEDKVDAVSLTGSNKAGEQVAERAGRGIRKVVLELGGSDPFIVLDDADVSKAGRMAVSARTINAGQSCIAAKRFIVMEKVAQEFREVFLSRLGELKIGDPMQEATDIGPVARKEIMETLQAQLQDAKEKGGEVLQTEYASAKGLFFPPTAVFNTNPEMRILTEEVFGPIAPVIIVRDEEEAIRVANNTEYGLGASIWTRDLVRAEQLAMQIESGCVVINDMVKSDPRLPFGGIKKSGIGRELSHYGLKEFVNIKTIVIKE